MKMKPLFPGLLILTLAACASPSPREAVHKQAVIDYDRLAADADAFARQNVKQLVSTTQAFYSILRRWPRTFQELGRFVTDTREPLDLTVFNELDFATLKDGSVQIYYDVNCSRFDTKEFQFPKAGTVNVKPN